MVLGKLVAEPAAEDDHGPSLEISHYVSSFGKTDPRRRTPTGVLGSGEGQSIWLDMWRRPIGALANVLYG